MKTYWIYQLAGWSTFAAIGLVINILNGGYVPGLVVSHVLFVFYGIGLTHLFRRRLQSRTLGRVRSALLRAVYRSIIGASLTFLVITTEHLVSGAHGSDWSLGAIAGLFWGMWIAAGVWCGLYIRITEDGLREQHEVRSRLALREAELRALESQINPHFLFNC